MKQIGRDYLEVYFCLLRGNKKFARGKNNMKWLSEGKKSQSHPFSIWLVLLLCIVVVLEERSSGVLRQ